MENASKALLMAAEVLIGILILSLMVYLFATFGSDSAKVNKQLEDNKLAEFNSQYDKYVNKDDVTIYDVITVTNLAIENNKYYELETSTSGNYYISIYLDRKTGGEDVQNLEKKGQDDLTGIIEYEELKIVDPTKVTSTYAYKILPKYDCKVEYSNITGRVKIVKFIEK